MCVEMMTGQTSTDRSPLTNKGEIGRHAYEADIPTLLLATAIYSGFLLTTWHYHSLPWFLVLIFGALVICLHGSLQHEAVHGYPFKSRRLNRWITGWSLWLWIPYDLYVNTHTRHHIDQDLTDPFLDPESNYLTQEQWARMSSIHKLTRHLMRTLAGRMLLGPGYYTISSLKEFVRDLRSADRHRITAWSWHLITVTVILYWVVGICRIPFWEYIIFFAYPGTSVALIRSYAEHRATSSEKTRSVICEAGVFWSLMFLYNNLHALHHAEPALAWYKRSARYRELKSQLLIDNGGYFINGYLELAKAYFFRPKESVFHPFKETPK